MEQYRKIKTQTKYKGRTYDIRSFPQITLKGDWLLKAGFECGINCSVKVETGRITILSI